MSTADATSWHLFCKRCQLEDRINQPAGTWGDQCPRCKQRAEKDEPASNDARPKLIRDAEAAVIAAAERRLAVAVEEALSTGGLVPALATARDLYNEVTEAEDAAVRALYEVRKP